MQITVLGAGSWGTMITILLARNEFQVQLVTRDIEHAQSINQCRENLRYLRGFVFPKNVHAITYDELDIKQVQKLVLATPVQTIRQISNRFDFNHKKILIASKGIETTTGLLPTQILKENAPHSEIAYLAGPNLALEIAKGMPAISVIASPDLELATKFAMHLKTPLFKVYLSQDIIGLEIAGALKNVLAIAAGVSDGLGYGQNTKAALITRGLNEMIRLGLKMNAHIETFVGAAGIGDLLVTTQSPLSRNYRVGQALAYGKTLKQAAEEIAQVAEGIYTSQAVMQLARRHQVNMPVFEAIYYLIQGQLDLHTGIRMLMEGVPTLENAWIAQELNHNVNS